MKRYEVDGIEDNGLLAVSVYDDDAVGGPSQYVEWFAPIDKNIDAEILGTKIKIEVPEATIENPEKTV